MDFSFGDFNAEIGSINPAALPPNKRRKMTLQKMVKNLFIVAYIVAFCAVYLLIFGKDNVLIGATLATCSLTMRKANLGIRASQAAGAIIFSYLLIAFGPLIGGINLFLAIPVNFLFLYVIATLTGQHVLQKTEYYFLAAYIFAESSPAAGVAFVLRLIALMVGAVYIAGLYFFFHRKEKGQHSLGEVFHRLHITSTRNRFALRIACGLMITMLIGDLFHLQYAAWMGMPVLSLSMPFVQDTQKRAAYRLIGTIFGGAVFLVLFQFVIPEFLHLWCLLLLLYVYLFLTDYRIQQSVIAIFSLNGATLFYGAGVAIEMRIILLFVGIAIVFAMNITEYLDVADRIESKLFHHRYRGPHPDEDDDVLPLEHKKF